MDKGILCYEGSQTLGFWLMAIFCFLFLFIPFLFFVTWKKSVLWVIKEIWA